MLNNALIHGKTPLLKQQENSQKHEARQMLILAGAPVSLFQCTMLPHLQAGPQIEACLDYRPRQMWYVKY